MPFTIWNDDHSVMMKMKMIADSQILAHCTTYTMRRQFFIPQHFCINLHKSLTLWWLVSDQRIVHIQWYSRLCTITCITSLTLFISRLGSDQTKPIPERRSNQKVPTHFKVQSFDQGDLAALMLTKRVSISNTKKVFGDITSMWGKIYTTKSSHYIHFIPLQQMNIDFFTQSLRKSFDLYFSRSTFITKWKVRYNNLSSKPDTVWQYILYSLTAVHQI